jgi:hypothetical protein
VNAAEHRKEMLIQKITHHREHMRLELEVLREANPVLPVIRGGRQVLGILGVLQPRHDTESGDPRSAAFELARSLLPSLLRVLRALLDRREEKRARERGS